MNIPCYLPLLGSPGLGDSSPEAAQIEEYLDRCITTIRSTFEEEPPASASGSAEDMLRVFLHREFNYQSKGRVAHLIPNLLPIFERVVQRGVKLPVFLLYHGGYRAAVGGSPLSHNFAPDIAELLLIYQVARLQQRIRAIHAPGVSFSIVINNGVAAHTNGIPYENTSGYVRKLRNLIMRLGAQDTVWVLEQAELGDFSARMAGVEVLPKAEIDPVDHAVVERFLGRTCSNEEARLKIATYIMAETVWGKEVRGIVEEHSGFFCRQVAHPACLSFRPFPGGAIRVQNGEVGFHLTAMGPVPAFVTPLTYDPLQPVRVPVHLNVFDGLVTPRAYEPQALAAAI